jgi:hypothetical protein
MKKFILLFAVSFLLISGGFAQHIETDKVPDAPKAALKKEFPKAIDQMWNLTGSTYQVIFSVEKTRHAMKFDEKGNWIDKETRISKTALPKEITHSIAKNFAGYMIYEAEKVETPTKGKLYNVGLEKGKELLEVHLSMKGDVMDKVSKEKKTDWGKDND